METNSLVWSLELTNQRFFLNLYCIYKSDRNVTYYSVWTCLVLRCSDFFCVSRRNINLKRKPQKGKISGWATGQTFCYASWQMLSLVWNKVPPSFCLRKAVQNSEFHLILLLNFDSDLVFDFNFKLRCRNSATGCRISIQNWSKGSRINPQWNSKRLKCVI